MSCTICHDAGIVLQPSSFCEGVEKAVECPNGCKGADPFVGLDYEQAWRKAGMKFIGNSIVQPYSDPMGRPVYAELT